MRRDLRGIRLNRDHSRRVRHRLVGAAAAILAAASPVVTATPAGAAPLPSVVGPEAPVVVQLDTATPIPDFVVAGSDADPVHVDVTTAAGNLVLPVTTGLTLVGGASGAELVFSGSQSDVNAALASLTYTGSTPGTTSVTVSLLPPGLFSCPSNGHFYQVVPGSYTFEQALADAAETFGGAGYLATVTSSAENDCVFAGIGAYTGDGRNAWIGARLVDGSVADWQWVTGPEAGTTFWVGGRDGTAAQGRYADWDRVDVQPQNDSGQACGQYYNSGSVPTWHDNGCGAGNKFVAESATPAVAIASATVSVRTLPAPPAPDDLTSTGIGTEAQTVPVAAPTGGSVTLLDGDVPVATVTVARQGTYVLDTGAGTITFTPVVGFVGTPTAVTYQLTDVDGQTGTADYTPEVDAPAGPVASDLTSTGPAGGSQSVSVPVPPGGSVRLLDAGPLEGQRVEVLTLTTPGQGTYTVDTATGVITFVAVEGFTGTATPVAFHILDAYGKSAIGSYTVTVEAAAVAPTTTNPTTSTSIPTTDPTTTTAAVPTGTTPTTPALAYTGLRVGTALGAVLALLVAGTAMTVVARRPRKRAH